MGIEVGVEPLESPKKTALEITEHVKKRLELASRNLREWHFNDSLNRPKDLGPALKTQIACWESLLEWLSQGL